MHRMSSVLLAAALVGCSHVSDLTQPKRVLTDREGDTRYEIVELPLLTGTVASGEAINEQGWVAGLAPRRPAMSTRR